MFDIIFQHDEFLVVNKHPNVSVHKDDGDTMLLEEINAKVQCEKLYLVHRLDKMTSGILLLAKNRAAARELSEQFAQRTVEKYYLAIGAKKPKKKQGLIAGGMERSRRSSWKLTNSTTNLAMTQFFSVAGESGQRIFLCKPHTGKTHQIRVALKSIGSAIVGDPIYNSSDRSDRGYLHAYALRFSYQGEVFSLQCSPAIVEPFSDGGTMGELWASKAMTLALQQWATPWELPWPKRTT